MALDLLQEAGGKKDINESLDLIGGADDCYLIQAGDVFNEGPIVALVPQEDSTITELIANDGNDTDIIAEDDGSGLRIGFKNIDGTTLKAGAFISAGKYQNGRSFKSVTCGSGAVWVYYRYPVVNS